jgi:hypothetical protein
MGLQELFKKIESDFQQETLLEFNIILNDVSNNLSPEERGIFLDWLEYEFLHNQLTLYDTQQVSLASVKEQLSSDVVQEIESVINKQKIYTEYLKKWLFENKSKSIKVESPEIDLSGSTAIEKIIYLHKLGVIDFLKNKQPFLSSTNKLAIILSAIIDEKSVTIQPMINPILSKKVDDKNNPLNSPKPLAKVTKQLNDIGFES